MGHSTVLFAIWRQRGCNARMCQWKWVPRRPLLLMEHTRLTTSQTSQLTWVTAQTNLLELDLDILRRYSGPHSSSAAKVDSIFVKSLTNFITSCICLYQISRQHTRVLPKTDIDPADASCISGVKGLVLMWEITHRQRHILEAVCLLTYLVESSTYNASARLMLIDLLRYLGLFSLTLPAYQGLKVRGILAETCCPAMFTRISLMLPSALKHEVGITKDLGKCLKFYETSMAEIPQFQQLALQKKNYASVISMAAFSDRLRCSLTRRMLTQERRRCSRASNNSPAAFDIHYSESYLPYIVFRFIKLTNPSGSDVV